MTEYHGWRIIGPIGPDARALHVGYLRARKQPALYFEGAVTGKILAYFQNDEDAREFMAWLDQLLERGNMQVRDGAP